MNLLDAYVRWVLEPILRRKSDEYSLRVYAKFFSVLFIALLASTAKAQNLDLIRATVGNCVAAMEAKPSIETRLAKLGWAEADAKKLDMEWFAGYRLSVFPEVMFGVAWGWRTEPARIGRDIVSGAQLKQAWNESVSELSALRAKLGATGSDEAVFILEHPETKSILVLEVLRNAEMMRGKCVFAATRKLTADTFDKLLTTTDYPLNYLKLPPMDTDVGRIRYLRGVSVKQNMFAKQINEPFPFTVVYWTINELQKQG